MDIDFEFWLILATGVSAIIWVLDKLLKLSRHSRLVKELGSGLLPILLIVVVIRSFVAEPFIIPSGSMKPDLLPGDFILVNKFAYGLRWPISHQPIFKPKSPERGDVMVFRFPPDTSKNYIKRVIGVPGDVITYRDKTLYINRHQATKTLVGRTKDNNSGSYSWPVAIYREKLGDVSHRILINPERLSEDFSNLEIPDNCYFMMGDNRDNSGDSRYWFGKPELGCVNDKHIVGKAKWVWFSWNKGPRWKRVGRTIL